MNSFPRPPILMPVQTAEPALFKTLELIAEESIAAEDFGRRAAREAVHACWTYLHDRGLSGQALKPLADVINAFEDVDRGKLPELFDPHAKAGVEGEKKWSQSTAARQTQLYAAACLSALMFKGTSKREAALKVARAVQHWPRISKGVIKATTVINWRDKILQEQSTDSARRFYEGIVEMLTVGPRSKALFAGILRDGPPFSGGVRKTQDRGPKT